MRKLYSLVLLAVGLLIGTNAWAQNTISLKYYGGAKADQTFATLQEAIDYVNPGDSATITLTANQTLSEGILIPHVTSVATDADKIVNRAGQRICIDLGGKTIKMTSGVNHTLFSLIKGTLRFTGKGTIKREAARNAGNVFHRCAIVVTGADANKNDATKDRSKQVWSTLYVDKDVTVIGHGNDCFGIGLNNIGDVLPDFAGFNKDFLGYTCYQPHGTGNMWDPTTSGYQFSAFGARLYIDGTVDGTVRGINILGSLNQTPGIVEGATARKYAVYPYYDHYFPYVKIGKNADVYCEPSGINDNGNGGIYLGGWAVVDIEGTVHGQTGVMVKAGDVLVHDGNVYSESNTSSANSGDYHGTVAGSGIFITSSSGYAGESNLTITGDSKITGNGGSAIIDVLGTGVNDTKVSHVTITGGTIEGGKEGAINLTTTTKADADVVAAGGNVTGDVKIGNTTVNVNTLVPNNTSYHTTEVTNEDGTKTVVISQGAAPTPGNKVSTQATNASVKWQGADYITDEISTDLKLAELEINDVYTQAEGDVDPDDEIEAGDPRPQKLTIKDGATLEVGRVVLGSAAQIIVEPGAKFIVTGTQGIVAPKTENITLQHNSNTNKFATFLFNPSVESNKHPNAIVQFTTNSWWADNSNLQWEWFGIPTYNTAKSITSKAGDDAIYATVEVFENNDWTDLGYIGGTYDNNPAVLAKLNQPFAAYNLLAYRAYGATAPEITISGELVGNVNAPLNANKRWNPFANSYTAEVDAQAFVSALSSSENIADAIYVAIQNNNGTIRWDVKADEQLTGLKLKPMQAFLLNNPRYVEETAIDYASMVYGPATANHAPRRFATADNSAKVTINVANENGTLDDVDLRENENAKSYEKYLNSDINIYVVDGEKNDYIVAEDLENTYVGFSTVKGGEFTISFADVEGREFDLIDLETGAKVAVNEGETYKFRAGANTVADYRFKLVERAKLPTAIENTEAVKSVKGIYTITGQYLGEMNVWNALPAGVYVVNGEKRVK